MAVGALTTKPIREPDENGFIEASRLVYDGVRDVRNAVLLIRVCLQTTESDEKKQILQIFNLKENDYDNSDSDIDNGETDENSSRMPIEYTEVDVSQTKVA